MRTLTLLSLLFLLGAGCTVPQVQHDSFSGVPVVDEIFGPAEVSFPVDEYIERRTYKLFGEYFEDRFTGYHVGDDVEFVDVSEDVPVRSMADGEVVFAGTISGYGGLIIINHDVQIHNDSVQALYGHVDIASAAVSIGDVVEQDQFLANLGAHESYETDGERKHLHFALTTAEERVFSGYVSSESAVDDWVNPQSFFDFHGLDVTPEPRQYDPAVDLGGDIFHLSFEIPSGWDVEYIPSLEALNLYTLDGSGSARERSQMMIRYFDASSFLTLSTVEVHETVDIVIGDEAYEARLYDIEKLEGVADFVDQPDWRNERHFVTDVRAEEGFTRYFVFAVNPEVGLDVYEQVLDTLVIE